MVTGRPSLQLSSARQEGPRNPRTIPDEFSVSWIFKASTVFHPVLGRFEGQPQSPAPQAGAARRFCGAWEDRVAEATQPTDGGGGGLLGGCCRGLFDPTKVRRNSRGSHPWRSRPLALSEEEDERQGSQGRQGNKRQGPPHSSLRESGLFQAIVILREPYAFEKLVGTRRVLLDLSRDRSDSSHTTSTANEEQPGPRNSTCGNGCPVRCACYSC